LGKILPSAAEVDATAQAMSSPRRREVLAGRSGSSARRESPPARPWASRRSRGSGSRVAETDVRERLAQLAKARSVEEAACHTELEVRDAHTPEVLRGAVGATVEPKIAGVQRDRVGQEESPALPFLFGARSSRCTSIPSPVRRAVDSRCGPRRGRSGQSQGASMRRQPSGAGHRTHVCDTDILAPRFGGSL